MQRTRGGGIFLFLLLGCGLFLSGRADIQIPPSPERWVTDTAGFLSPQALQTLDARLEAYDRQAGHQVIVYIGKTTGGYPIEEFADKAFQAWAVGRKGLDDGVALFIMAEDRTIRVEIGYGLESVIPDILAGRIINDILIPKLKVGDSDGAVNEAVSAILRAISGEAVPAPELKKGRRSAVKDILIILAVIAFAIFFITNPSLALWFLINIFGGGAGSRSGGSWSTGRAGSSRGGSWGGGGWSRSSGGGFRSSGGGFRGGGGRSGGGGASGRW